MYVTFGYSLGSNGTSIINLNGKDTRRLLARYGLHTYADGVCYYTHWIRHSNNNDPSKGIMEYAIVRNNVYKLTFMAWDMISHTNRRLIRNLSIRHLPVRMTRTILLPLPARTIRITHRRLQGLMIRIIHQRHPDRMILMTRISIRLSRSRWL